MLVLTRRIGQRIMLDGDIVITVCAIGRGGEIRVGIEAPKNVRIWREEVPEITEQEMIDEARERR